MRKVNMVILRIEKNKLLFIQHWSKKNQLGRSGSNQIKLIKVVIFNYTFFLVEFHPNREYAWNAQNA